MSAKSRCSICQHPRGPQRGCQGAPVCQQTHPKHTNKRPCAHECHDGGQRVLAGGQA